MIMPITKKEEEIWIKKNQIFFVIKKSSKWCSKNFIETLESSIFNKNNEEIEELYKIYAEKIKNEQWVYYPPHYYHITEFDKALKLQFHIDLTYAPNEYYIDMMISVKKFYEKVKKHSLGELTLEQKKELYGLTNPITY